MTNADLLIKLTMFLVKKRQDFAQEKNADRNALLEKQVAELEHMRNRLESICAEDEARSCLVPMSSKVLR